MALIVNNTLQAPRRDPEIVEGLELLERRLIISKGDEKQAWDDMMLDEMDFVAEQLYRCTRGPGITGLLHFLCNYFFIKDKKAGFHVLYPLWDSQLMLLEVIDKKWKAKEAIWLLILKARQLGISTICEGIILYLTIFNKNWNSLLLADVPGRTEYIFEMARNGLESLPWWMRPERRYNVKGHHMIFDRESEVDRLQRPGLKSQLIAESANQRTGAAIGKAQPLDAKILTPNGWKRMGDIHVGDHVIAVDGHATKVTAVYPQGEKEIFEVTMTDRTSTQCCDEHLWLTDSHEERRNRKRSKATKWQPKVRQLSEIRKTLTVRGDRANHMIPMMSAPARFFTQPTPLPAYFMGALLGDGGFTSNTPVFTTADAGIIEICSAMLPSGLKFQHRSKYDYGISCGSGRNGGEVNPLTASLRKLGLKGLRSHEKFVPDVYKFNTVNVRLEVLRGLMDTDGEATKLGCALFSTTSVRLAEDVQFLAESLGGTGRINGPKLKKFKYKGVVKIGKPAYSVTVALPSWYSPFALPRKTARSVKRMKNPLCRSIAQVKSVGMKPAQCITVEHPSQLYVTDHCIVTHNTFLALHATEVPFYKDVTVLTEGILPTVPENHPAVFAILEGVAKQRHDHWHRLWRAGEEGLSKFEDLFIPWYGESQYFLAPPEGWKPTTETAAMTKAVFETFEVTLLPGQAHWYENKRNDYLAFEEDDATFLTQYPSNPHEAFQNAGRCAFSKRKLHNIMLHFGRPPKWRGEIWLAENNRQPKLTNPNAGDDRLKSGRLKIWEWPWNAKKGDAKATFYVSGDPSGGTATGHPACWQVLVIPSSPFEPVRQVACWTGKAGPSQFARIGAALGYLYDLAEVNPEANNMGQTVVSDLKNVLMYPRIYRWIRDDKVGHTLSEYFGWLMTRQSKKALITRMAEGVSEDLIIIRDPDTIDELYDFITDDGENYYAVTEEGHGDRGIALFIGYYCIYQSRPFKERSSDRDDYLQKKFDPNRDFVNTDYAPDHEKSHDTEGLSKDFQCL